MKIRRTLIKGLDRVEDADLILGFIKQVKRNTNLKLPNEIIFKRLRGCNGRATFRGDYTRILMSIDISFTESVFTFIHELIHISGHWHHKKSFWRSFFNNCIKMNLAVHKNFVHYKSGKRYLTKLQGAQ